jgi:hypothetical protein
MRDFAMNISQRITLWVGFGMILLSALFPPWEGSSLTNENLPKERHTTVYSFLSSNPPPMIDSVRSLSWAENGTKYQIHFFYFDFRLDSGRLIVQELTIIFLTTIALVALGRRSEN